MTRTGPGRRRSRCFECWSQSLSARSQGKRVSSPKKRQLPDCGSVSGKRARTCLDPGCPDPHCRNIQRRSATEFALDQTAKPAYRPPNSWHCLSRWRPRWGNRLVYDPVRCFGSKPDSILATAFIKLKSKPKASDARLISSIGVPVGISFSESRTVSAGFLSGGISE